MENTLKLAKQSLENNELEKFLKGEKPYTIQVNYMVPADVPTDWTEVIPEGIYKLFSENPNLNIDKKLEETLMKMIKDNLGVYSSLNILYFQLIMERDKRSPFILEKKRIINNLKKYLSFQKGKLKKDFRWEGKNNANGLWGDVERICNLINAKFGIKLI